MAMVAVGMASLVATSLLFLHITYSLISWKLRDIRYQKGQTEKATKAASPQGVDLQLGLTESQYYQTRRGKPEIDTEINFTTQGEVERTETALSNQADQTPSVLGTSSLRREKPPNPLLLLIYNLILADVGLSAAYANDATWLRIDGIITGTRTCEAQGWIISFGCVSTSGFLFTIAVFSYLGIIRGYKATQRDVLIASSVVWVASIVLPSIGPVAFHNHQAGDPFYARETLWVSLSSARLPPDFLVAFQPANILLQCWISKKHAIWRLSVYLWGFPAMVGTFLVYSNIFYKLWKEGRSSRFMPRRRHGSSSTGTTHLSVRDENHERTSTPLRPSGHHPAFLIYPCIYLIVGTPLMLGSSIPGLETSPAFMGFAGTILASTGLLDAILWSSIIFLSGKEDLANTGLDQFTFVRTPEGRTLGNIVFVQGGRGSAVPDDRHHRHSWHSRKDKGWWRLGDRNDQGLISQEQWADAGHDGIQMEVITSVVIEKDTAGHSRQSSGNEVRSMESAI